MKVRIKVVTWLAGGLMIWLAAASDRWSHAFSFTGQQRDYYNLLVFYGPLTDTPFTVTTRRTILRQAAAAP